MIQQTVILEKPLPPLFCSVSQIQRDYKGMALLLNVTGAVARLNSRHSR
jgi:hypothetical protein